MKKLFAKLALFGLISLIITSSLTAYAAEEEAAATQCIKQDEHKNPDEQCGTQACIITIIEEAFGKPSSKKEIKENPGYQTRLCTRETTIITIITTDEDNKENKTKTSKTELISSKCTPEKTETKTTDKTETKIVICDEVMVILSAGGSTMIEGYIKSIYKWSASIVGLIAVAVIILSGVQISMSAGDTQAVENSKTRILKSLSGLAILFLSGLILYTVNPTFFVR